MFSLAGKTALITGGSGVLGAGMSKGLASAGAQVAVLGRTLLKAESVAAEITAQGGTAMAIAADVLDQAQIQESAAKVIDRFGKIDVLVNGAGGNAPQATTSAERRFFDLPSAVLKEVFDLNWLGTIIPTQVIGAHMAKRGSGAIINISSMAAFRPMTRVLAYASAKAAINNFTAWLATYLATEFSPNIRVNALAPGFFFTEQNRFLLTDADTGNLTERGQKIIDHTPMRRFGTPEDLVGALIWLASDAAQFVTGAVIPIDGGFSAYSGV